jgi:ubiquinone/menaquinone biosynthesis C-methylase UbiE
MKASTSRLLQIATAVIICIFIFGFIYSPLGVWTCAVLSAWFIGTQRVGRGFVVLVSISFIFTFLSNLRGFSHPDTSRKLWANNIGTLALLRSPKTGETLNIVTENGHEFLVSRSGESFPVRNGIPVFQEMEKLTGSNHKYNKLYEIIGGFYDDIQRVACGLRGIGVERYLRDYLQFLEIGPGDSVLETSVGTGLNYKYLARDMKLSGLDLSAEMLTNCQTNLHRWKMDADLFLGNAEELPFANDSFDVVFHVGGINFFNDRAKAIREMIRVAKSGSRLLIADETEEHVKKVYEGLTGTRGYFSNPGETVVAPVDLVPRR